MKLSGNPVIKHKYTADPTALVFQDKIFLYTGHDQTPVGVHDYVMNEWFCFSSTDLINWEDHHSPLKATDFSWAEGGAFATTIIQRHNQFYWYAAVNHKTISGSAIGVAVSKNPAGKFKDAAGAAIITRNMLPENDHPKINLDPAVLVDDDGQAYIFWGNQQCFYAKLSKDMISLEGAIKMVELPGFEEGAHIHKRNGWYYLSYGYEMPEKVGYAMSRNIDGPWEFKGILNEIAGNCETNRPCIVDFKDRHFFFYHNGALKHGGSHRRSVCVDELFYHSDGTIKRIVMTSEGVNLKGESIQ